MTHLDDGIYINAINIITYAHIHTYIAILWKHVCVCVCVCIKTI